MIEDEVCLITTLAAKDLPIAMVITMAVDIEIGGAFVLVNGTKIHAEDFSLNQIQMVWATFVTLVIAFLEVFQSHPHKRKKRKNLNTWLSWSFQSKIYHTKRYLLVD